MLHWWLDGSRRASSPSDTHASKCYRASSMACFLLSWLSLFSTRQSDACLTLPRSTRTVYWSSPLPALQWIWSVYSRSAMLMPMPMVAVEVAPWVNRHRSKNTTVIRMRAMIIPIPMGNHTEAVVRITVIRTDRANKNPVNTDTVTPWATMPTWKVRVAHLLSRSLRQDVDVRSRCFSPCPRGYIKQCKSLLIVYWNTREKCLCFSRWVWSSRRC